MAALLFPHHNILNETVRVKYRPSKVSALSEGLYNLASIVWHGGSPHQPHSKCKTATIPNQIYEVHENQEILADRQKFREGYLRMKLAPSLNFSLLFSHQKT